MTLRVAPDGVGKGAEETVSVGAHLDDTHALGSQLGCKVGLAFSDCADGNVKDRVTGGVRVLIFRVVGFCCT